jgi:dsDNA-binding SOS-regulon protein
MTRMSQEQYDALTKKPKHKFGAKPTTVDGIRFASKKEADRYGQLKLLEYAGKVKVLVLQAKYPIDVNGKHICIYIADFSYIENGKEVIEDCKGVRTPVYLLKKKLMKALYGIDILET